MAERFLRAKHWQIFLLVVIIPYTIQFTALAININDPQRIMDFSPFIMVIFIFGLFGWLYSLATGLQHKVPAGVKMNVRKFKIFLIIPMIYIPISFHIANLLFDNLSQANGEINTGMFGVTFAIIFPLHILSIFGILYSYYFVAKTYKTVELQREVTFSDFAGDFLLLMFFPIGIWVIQPKINSMTFNMN